MLKTFLQRHGVKLFCLAVVVLAGVATPTSVAQALHIVRFDVSPSNPVPHGGVVTINWTCGDPSHVPQGVLRKRVGSTITTVQTGTYFGYNYGLYSGHGVGGTYTTTATANMEFSMTCSVLIGGRNNHVSHPMAWVYNPAFGYAYLPSWHQVTVDPPPPTPCTSAPNACGMTSTGTMVGGVCNASVPPNSLCAAPTTAINASPTTVLINTPTTITATFAPGAGDSLTGTAIYGPNSTAVVPGGDTSVSLSKNYVFTPTSVGDYVFRAAVRSSVFPTWTSTQSVTVTATMPNQPSISISVVGGDSSIPVGTPVTIRTVVTPSAGDTLTGLYTAGTSGGAPIASTLHDPAWGNPFSVIASVLTALQTGTPLAQAGDAVTPITTNLSQEYIFNSPSSPAAAGSYTFRPMVRTTNYPTWSDYGHSVSVEVEEPLSCPGPHEINPPTCSCELGFQRVPPSTICTSIPIVEPPADPVLSLSSASPRVQAGSPTTLTWSVSGLIDTDSCNITSAPSGVFTRNHAPGAATTWSGSAATGPVTSGTTFTLSCSRGTSQTVTVGIIPIIIEI